MPVVKLSQIRQAVAEQIDNLAGFKQSTFPVSLFGRTPNQLAHLAYSVSCTASTARPDRQNIAVGVYVDTTVQITFAYRIRPANKLLDIDNAMDKEQDVIAAILASYSSIRSGMQISYQNTNRTFPESMEYMLIAIEFVSYHHIQGA